MKRKYKYQIFSNTSRFTLLRHGNEYVPLLILPGNPEFMFHLLPEQTDTLALGEVNIIEAAVICNSFLCHGENSHSPWPYFS